MTGAALHPDALRQLVDLLSHRLGLHYPPRKHPELAHKVARLSRSIGFTDAAACLDWLISAKDHSEITKRLVSVCTVGETYFFREPDALKWFMFDGLPPLLAAARSERRPLRVWSAGCCTGEEPYSLSILLRDSFATHGRFEYKVYGTDVNEEYLTRARAAKYGPWSFRSVPDPQRARHFTPMGKDYVLRGSVRDQVSFEVLNLAATTWPGRYLVPGYFDAIFCRNVLMYFTESTMRHALQRFRTSLRPGGWALVSATESSLLGRGNFRRLGLPPYVGAADNVEPPVTVAEPPLSEFVSDPPNTLPEFRHAERELGAWENDGHDGALAGDARDTLLPPDDLAEDADALEAAGRLEEACLALARSDSLEQNTALQLRYARLCHLTGAQETAARWCKRALEEDALNAAGYSLLAAIQRESGHINEALAALQRALYLDQDSAAVHFRLGFIFQELGRPKPSRIHFRNAATLLSTESPETIIAELGDLSAGRLAEIAHSMAQAGENA